VEKYEPLYFVDDIEITDDVNKWIEDNNIPDYEYWTNSYKILFKLTFG